MHHWMQHISPKHLSHQKKTHFFKKHVSSKRVVRGKTFSGENPYEERYGDNWKEELKKAPSMKKYR
jgi:hypothetical protein